MQKKKKQVNQKRDYAEIVAKYQTGQYGLRALAKMYNISASSLSEYLNRHNIKKNEHAEKAIQNLNNGFRELAQVAQSDVIEAAKRTHEPTLIVSEVVEIVKNQNPAFAKAFQKISAEVIKSSLEILDRPIKSASDLKLITGAIKDMNDTLQVIPKPPAFAQQINFNKQQTNQNNELKPIDIKIEFK